FAGRNNMRHLLGNRRASRDSGRAQLRLHRRSYHRPSSDADELCRRRAQNRAPVCSRRLLLLGAVRPLGGRRASEPRFGPREEQMKHSFLLYLSVLAISGCAAQQPSPPATATGSMTPTSYAAGSAANTTTAFDGTWVAGPVANMSAGNALPSGGEGF